MKKIHDTEKENSAVENLDFDFDFDFDIDFELDFGLELDFDFLKEIEV